MPKKSRTLKPEPCGPLKAYHKAQRGRQGSRFYWQVMWHSGGVSHSVTGASGWYTRREVARMMAELVARDVYRRQRAEGTVYGLLEAWMEHEAQNATQALNTLKNKRVCSERLDDVLGAVRLDRLTARVLHDAVTQMRTGSDGTPRYADSTVRLTLKYLKIAWKWGRKHGVTPDVDLPLPRMPSTKRSEPVYNDRLPTSEEVEATIDAMADDWRRWCVELMYATGARPGDITHLSWADFELGDRPRMHIGAGTKTGRRTVPLGGPIAARLRELRKLHPDGRHWHGRDNPLTPGIRQALRRACREAGVQPWTPKALRKLAATTLCGQGVPVNVAARILGHSVQVMLEVYARVQAENADEAVAMLGRQEAGQVIPMRRRKV